MIILTERNTVNKLHAHFFGWKAFVFLQIAVMLVISCAPKEKTFPMLGQNLIMADNDSILPDTIIYHPVRVDEHGSILPWYSNNLGESYSDVIQRVWEFWINISLDSNNIPYYMNHQVWRPGHDMRGLGGDQLQMALSSWDLLYNFTGNKAIIDNMQFIADYYLDHSLSPPGYEWPYLPFPYNTDIHSGKYDGDMILGKGYLQPDKAGSFGFELLKLYKKTSHKKYLDAAINIANTLSEKVQEGDDNNSPWPFKVNAKSGETGVLVEQEVWYLGMDEDIKKGNAGQLKSSYTTFWTGSLELFDGLIQLGYGDTTGYRKAFRITIDWMKKYPVMNNKWGPFFEDVPGWSDTQINAITFARYLLENPELDLNCNETVKGIIEWVHSELENHQYLEYGVIPTDEQTAYRQPGNSHSARQASIELMYWQKTGDITYLRNAIKQLNWATYMVDYDGKNFYPTNDIWMTDGYGDYVRHYLRAMAAAPQLAPDNSDHLLKSSSIIQSISYGKDSIFYKTFDHESEEIFRLVSKPSKILTDGDKLREKRRGTKEGWYWQELDKGGILKIEHTNSCKIVIII